MVIRAAGEPNFRTSSRLSPVTMLFKSSAVTTGGGGADTTGGITSIVLPIDSLGLAAGFDFAATGGGSGTVGGALRRDGDEPPPVRDAPDDPYGPCASKERVPAFEDPEADMPGEEGPDGRGADALVEGDFC